MPPHVLRISLFRLAADSDTVALVDGYARLPVTAMRAGQPYVLAAAASTLETDARSQSYNFCVRARFASLADMHYYDALCPAHAALRTAINQIAIGPPLLASVPADEPY